VDQLTEEGAFTESVAAKVLEKAKTLRDSDAIKDLVEDI